MTKIVKNCCYGGFGLSPEAQIEYLRRKHGEVYAYERTEDYNRIPLEDYEGTFGQAVTHIDQGDMAGEKLEGYFLDASVDRTDPVLAEVVEEMGEEANGSCAQLTIVEVPDDAEWFIDDYDGQETIRESHRTW
jgi:hypothetical protein